LGRPGAHPHARGADGTPDPGRRDGEAPGAGADADTPAAVIANGTLEDQRVIVGTLATIVRQVRDARLDPPATLVVEK